jgi:hypothetical protein
VWEFYILLDLTQGNKEWGSFISAITTNLHRETNQEWDHSSSRQGSSAALSQKSYNTVSLIVTKEGFLPIRQGRGVDDWQEGVWGDWPPLLYSTRIPAMLKMCYTCNLN